MVPDKHLYEEHFYPRPPRGGRLPCTTNRHSLCVISIHALREEGDPTSIPSFVAPIEFLSTPSARRATKTRLDRITDRINISIHALREEGDTGDAAGFPAVFYFYPRPPRGGRPRRTSSRSAFGYFYPRPPRGGRLCSAYPSQTAGRFLSTPSARRATPSKASRKETNMNFYPRPPRGGRPRAPTLPPTPRNFYPRPPRGGRLDNGFADTLLTDISIHALREEGDGCSTTTTPSQTYFYPRPPRGGRRRRSRPRSSLSAFLSTPSARRAT